MKRIGWPEVEFVRAVASMIMNPHRNPPSVDSMAGSGMERGRRVPGRDAQQVL